jgi:glycosyltransferase involved in cell wall biosynthesis
VVCHNAAAFAKAVDDLLDANTEARDMARRARRSIEGQFSWRTHSQTLSELLIRVAGHASD